MNTTDDMFEDVVLLVSKIQNEMKDTNEKYSEVMHKNDELFEENNSLKDKVAKLKSIVQDYINSD